MNASDLEILDLAKEIENEENDFDYGAGFASIIDSWILEDLINAAQIMDILEEESELIGEEIEILEDKEEDEES